MKFLKQIQKNIFNFFNFLIVFFFEKFKKCMHERWRKINDRGCQIKWNGFKSGHKIATCNDTPTSIPLGKIDDFAQNKASFFGSYSFSKKNTRHFLWSREKPKNRWYFYVEMTSSSIVPHLTYILLIVSIGGRLDKSSKWRISRGEWAARNRPSIVPEIQGRWRDDSIAL